LQPDTIIPDQTNPQAFNRFAYVLNNPVRYTDPSGHLCVEGTSYCVNSNTHRTSGSLTNYDDSIYRKPRGGGGGSGFPPFVPPDSKCGRIRCDEDEHAVITTFDSSDFFDGVIPFNPEQLQNWAYTLDLIAFGIDLGVEGASLIATTGGLTLGGPAALATWVDYQIWAQPAIQLANVVAVFATAASVAGDLVSGKTGFEINIETTESHLAINYHGVTSTNTKTSIGLTQLGILAPISELSLPIQYLAVSNDLGNHSTFFEFLFPGSEINLGFSIPLNP